MTSLDPFNELLFGGGSAAGLSVSQLTHHLTCLVQSDVILQDVWVRGEVSNLTRAASGHVYFSLKDENACLGSVMWRSTAQRLAFRPEPGMQVVAHGQVDVYAPRGQYQLIVDELEPDGAGALFMALEQTKARLLAEGLLDAGRKRPLPAFPERVAIVTSLQGAAVRDMCVTLQRHPFPPQIVLVPALVQGDGAATSLCDALARANDQTGADLIIIGRGGGSIEDLWSFNAEALARAIAASRLPVITAVGHETDITLADLVGDVRAATPTAAAELVLARRCETLLRMELASQRARELLSARLETARLLLAGMSARTPLARPAGMVEHRRQRLDDLMLRLERAAELCRTRWRHRLALAAGKLEAVSPLSTLARGYSLVTRLPEGTLITHTGEVGEGDRLRIQVTDGEIEAAVMPVRPSRTGDEDAGDAGPIEL